MKLPDRTMEPVEVYAGQLGHVVIRQAMGGGEAIVVIHWAQVPLLIGWMREVASEIQAYCDSQIRFPAIKAPEPGPLALPTPPPHKDTSESR